MNFKDDLKTKNFVIFHPSDATPLSSVSPSGGGVTVKMIAETDRTNRKRVRHSLARQVCRKMSLKRLKLYFFIAIEMSKNAFLKQ